MQHTDFFVYIASSTLIRDGLLLFTIRFLGRLNEHVKMQWVFSKSSTTFRRINQWIFQVPVKGARGYITP